MIKDQDGNVKTLLGKNKTAGWGNNVLQGHHVLLLRILTVNSKGFIYIDDRPMGFIAYTTSQ